MIRRVIVLSLLAFSLIGCSVAPQPSQKAVDRAFEQIDSGLVK